MHIKRMLNGHLYFQCQTVFFLYQFRFQAVFQKRFHMYFNMELKQHLVPGWGENSLMLSFMPHAGSQRPKPSDQIHFFPLLYSGGLFRCDMSATEPY